MKKNLLMAALILPLLSVSAQWTQVGGTVKVMPNTLKYVEQNYEVTGTSSTLNEGKINVRGDFNAATAATGMTGAGFHNVWTGRNDYGQLIVDAENMASGTIDSQYKLPGGFAYTPVTFPFTDMTAGKAASQSEITNGTFQDFSATSDDGFMPGRYRNTIWTWHNSDDGRPESFYFQHENAENNSLTPELYHAINTGNQASDDTPPNTATKNAYLGIPENGNGGITLESSAYTMGYSWSANDVGELFASYVEDVAVAKPTGWRMATAADNEQPGTTTEGVAANGYGDNISLFANPFTSNIQLNGVDTPNALNNITHVFYIVDNTYEDDYQGSTDGSQVYVTTLDGNGEPATGNVADALLVRPHETFFFKASGAVNVALGENVKTFEPKTTTNFTERNGNFNNGFYQVTLDLFNNLGEELNNKAYVFASNEIQPNVRSRYEAYNTTIGNLGFYSLQENADGTVFADLADQKVLINGVNATDYVALPIHLGFKGQGTFTVKTRLTQNLANSSNVFYFEDTETGLIFEVTPDFEYTFTSAGNTEDRFNMYWNGIPENMATDDVNTVSQTLVYKDNKEFKVRFAETWNKADVYVYNMLGQLVHIAKGVNTANDYLLPLKGNASAYIVKAVSDNGEVSTQKIVKQ